jgi:hypothetical protein
MRTQTVLALAMALLLAGLSSCGGGGGGSNQRAGGVSTADVAITWRGTAEDVAGYLIHWGTASGSYTHDVDVADPVADAQGIVTVVIALPIEDSSTTLYFAMTSYDAAGATSAYSNELSIEVSALD